MRITKKKGICLILGMSWIMAAEARVEPTSTLLGSEKSDKETIHKQQLIPHINLDGNIRSYYFTRDYGNATPNRSAFSLGGKLNLLTDPLWDHFRIGATLYTAQPLGMNAANPAQVDKSLPGTPVTALGQSYLQYQSGSFLVRAGNQLISTPWINMEDSRMIPDAFQGIYSTYTPVTDLTLTAMRLTRFKNKTASSFSQTNLFNPENGGSIAALNGVTTIGSAALGANYHHKNLSSQVWGYQFYDYAKLIYGDIEYTLAPSSDIKPILGLQAAHEWNDGNAVMKRLGLGNINATAYGALVGVAAGNAKMTLGYNKIPSRSNTDYHHGNLVSPYTSGSDPLYTTSMIDGLIEKAPGSAYKIGAEYYLYQRQILLKASYAKYNTEPFAADTTETNFDAKYQIGSGKFKDLSLRARLGILNGNIAMGRLVYTRLMLQYDFG